MGALGVLFAALIILSLAISVWRIITLPRRVKRSVQGVRTAVGAIQQRQADKAAGKPVAPISVLAITGMVLAFVGIIVARTASAIIGLGMIVIGLGVMLIGINIAQSRQRQADQGGWPSWQGGGPVGPGGYGTVAPPKQTTWGSPAAFGASPSAAGHARQPVASQRPIAPVARRFNMPPTWPAAPPGWTPGPDWEPDPSWPPAPPGWQFWTGRTR